MPSERSYDKYPVIIQDPRASTSETSPSQSSSTASSESGSDTSSSAYAMGVPVQINQAPRDVAREGGHRETIYRVPGGKKDTVTKISRGAVDVINQDMRRADPEEPRSKDASSSDYLKSGSKHGKKK